ncbi:hypothetical protein AB6B38_08630 [Glycocaulis abyssi]|uniref:Integron gene cassette protein n=1 Tax=Glycocaulis abyssi TaxID=1433403 RepID=A0ABV9NBA8_9PROT
MTTDWYQAPQRGWRDYGQGERRMHKFGVKTPVIALVTLLFLFTGCSEDDDFIHLSVESQRSLIEGSSLNERTMYVFIGCLARNQSGYEFSDERGPLFSVILNEELAAFNSCVDRIIVESCDVYLTALYSPGGVVDSVWRVEPRNGEYHLCEGPLPSR